MNSLELIELSSINNVSWFRFPLVVKLDDSYWTSWENNLELIELSSINKVSLV